VYRQTIFVLLVLFLSVPLLAAQEKPAKLSPSAPDAGASCSRVGEVLGRNVFAQTFLLKQEDGQMNTVPFSRWTGFFKISPDSRSGRSREIEPTDIRLGDRLCVRLDPSGATANFIFVLEPSTPASNPLNRMVGRSHRPGEETWWMVPAYREPDPGSSGDRLLRTGTPYRATVDKREDT
jgi:hypothetical protein